MRVPDLKCAVMLLVLGCGGPTPVGAQDKHNSKPIALHPLRHGSCCRPGGKRQVISLNAAAFMPPKQVRPTGTMHVSSAEPFPARAATTYTDLYFNSQRAHAPTSLRYVCTNHVPNFIGRLHLSQPAPNSMLLVPLASSAYATLAHAMS